MLTAWRLDVAGSFRHGCICGTLFFVTPNSIARRRVFPGSGNVTPAAVLAGPLPQMPL
jgi:hypothetical protein